MSVARAAGGLRAVVDGGVVLPQDAGYDEARQVFNAAIDRRPAAVVTVAHAADVAAAVRHAREHGLRVSVRAGGHGFGGAAVGDDAVALDLSLLSDVEIDAPGRSAWAEAGVLAGEYTAAAGAHGLATGFGDTPTVGIAGLTLGGGIGFLVRRYGLTIDSLLAAELVTAEGDLLAVDPEREPDLFWALRGGGGAPGVVTRLRLRLHEVSQVVGGLLVLPASAGALEELVALGLDAPDELSLIVHVGIAPPAPFIPDAEHGRPVIMVMPTYAGDPAAGERAVAPLRSIAEPIVDLVARTDYPALFQEEAGPPRAAFAVRSGFLDALAPGLAARIVDRIEAPAPAPMRMIQMRILGGAVAQVPAEATAFAHRQRRLLVVTGAAGAPAQAGELEAWAAEAHALVGLAGTGAYVNYLGAGDPAEAFPQTTAQRLDAVRRRYDPDGVFGAGAARPLAPAAP
jgi:FAD/FMN-containing dehydrogenase